VVFPAPVGPTRAIIWPGSATNEMPLSTMPEGSGESGAVASASREAMETVDGAG